MATIKHPKFWVCLTCFLSLVAGATAIVLADFGKPVWVFILLGLWLCTLGLPTTLAVLLAAALWGNVPFIATPPLWAFMVCAAMLALGFQTGFFVLIARFYRWRARRQA